MSEMPSSAPASASANSGTTSVESTKESITARAATDTELKTPLTIRHSAVAAAFRSSIEQLVCKDFTIEWIRVVSRDTAAALAASLPATDATKRYTRRRVVAISFFKAFSV